MFWRFGGYANISSLDTILDKPDVTVEELLDESDLIQELKQQNGKLIEFLRDEPVLHKLLQYVVADAPLEPVESPAPEETGAEKSTGISFFGSRRKSRSRSKSVNKSADLGETEEDKKEAQRKKYAYVACEVLSSEVWSITEALLESRDHLREFWDYLKRPAPLDALQAGYFTKVNETLLDKKTEDMLAVLKSLDAIVPQMLKHVDCPMVMDLLLKMISLEKHEGGQGIVDWLQSQDLIPILLSYLSPSNPLATQTSAGDFLKAIITISANATAQDQTVIGPNELTRQLVSEECVAQLISDMLEGGNPLTVGVGIIIEVIRKNNSDYDLDNQVGPEPRTSDPIYLGSLLRQFAKAVPDFMDLVRNKAATKPELKAAFGEKIQPLGFDRFKTCELMAELLHCSNMGLLNERGSEAEMRQRDQDRERLKAEGKLARAPASTASDAEEAFASSVDSHGFHHAQMPGDELGSSPENVNDLEIQNATDEDGFEKVAVPDTEALPDEVNFDDFSERIEEVPQTLSDRSPASKKKPEVTSEDAPSSPTSASLTEKMQGLDIERKEQSDESRPEGKRGVSLLTEQIQEHLQDSGVNSQLEEQQMTEAPVLPRPEDKPAPLFASKSSPIKGVDPILGLEDEQNEDMGTQSTATLQPENAAGEDPENAAYETDIDGTPVVGDMLKIQFVEHQVVPTILDFFFRFPWNNFLHNVVYDVVQQVFNGTLERGYNRTLALNLFAESQCTQLTSTHDVTNRVLDGQKASDESQKEKGMRLGYMGHLTLIAEEVCKFAERHPPELLGDQVMERVMREEWITYVEGTLTQTRDKDNAVLGGVRPENALSARGGGGLLGQSSFASGNANSSALASAGLGGVPADTMALEEAGSSGYDMNAGTSGLLSGFGDGEEDEEEDGMEGERLERTVSDDEQASNSPTPAVPPPLNIAPSRARRQLALRLAARKRESEIMDTDPDAADPAALETAAQLPTEPLGDITDLDLGAPTEHQMREAGITGLSIRGSPARSFQPTLNSGDTDSGGEHSSGEETNQSSSDDDDDDLEDDEERTTRMGVVRRRSRKQRERRPSTTEARVRTPLEDDEDPDFGGGRDLSLDAPGEGEGEGPFADPVDLGTSSEEDSSDEDLVEIRPRRTS